MDTQNDGEVSLDRWQEIENELARMRQHWSTPKDMRKLGPADFQLRPILASALQRYTRGRCLDFAVAMAEANPTLKLAGFYAGNDLVHAFLVDESRSCVDVSGIWTLAEMKELHASDGDFSLRMPSLSQVLSEIKESEREGAEFDGYEVVLSVAGCLPHVRRFLPSEYIVDDAEEALTKLTTLAEGGYDPGSVSLKI